MAARSHRRRNDGLAQRASSLPTPPERSRLEQRYSRIPDGRQIPVYRDRHGVVVTEYGGPTQPVGDVYRVQVSELRTRPGDQQTAPTPNRGHTQAQSAEPPQQTPTPNPRPTREEFVDRCDIFSLTPTGLLIKYFVRVDKWGGFHIYPDRGGPFQSLQEAQHAIDSYHVVGRKNLCMDGLSSQERSVRYALYWHHDGTRKNSAEAFAAMATRRPVKEVVKALLDKYNEDNSRFGDLAHELKDIVSYKQCFDGKGCAYRSYSHLNMTMKTKGAVDPAYKLFFAEVTCMIDEHEEYVLTCFCGVEPDDNGECRVCGHEMKHPTHAKYNHGRSMPRFRCSDAYFDAGALYNELVTVRDEAWLKEEEARVRRMFKEVDNTIKADSTRDKGHGKSPKYVVPARRKMSCTC